MEEHNPAAGGSPGAAEARIYAFNLSATCHPKEKISKEKFRKRTGCIAQCAGSGIVRGRRFILAHRTRAATGIACQGDESGTYV